MSESDQEKGACILSTALRWQRGGGDNVNAGTPAAIIPHLQEEVSAHTQQHTLHDFHLAEHTLAFKTI